MLPSVVADELTHSLRDFLRATFPVSTPYFRGPQRANADGENTWLIEQLTDSPDTLFKGPYLSLALPFRRGEGTVPFKHVKPAFPPWKHQQQAFDRLCGQTLDAPLGSTLVATGTGSGKTECFLYPLLEHCARVRSAPGSQGKNGIKALIIYPMNALATDQARRFAKECARLSPKLTVGLFTGDTESEPCTVMREDSVITCKDTLRRSPPDILLTNYKMLDYLLMRPQDQPLWKHNTPGMLRYLVVDELHTFDGAQGTDLACLIRRLRERLAIGDEMACVGTSATIGGEGGSGDMLAYASDVFATPFDASSLVREDRLSAKEYLNGAEEKLGEIAFRHVPRSPAELDSLTTRDHENAADYLAMLAASWFPVQDRDTEGEAPSCNPAILGDPNHAEHERHRILLGNDLRRHSAFHDLLGRLTSVTDMQVLASDWQRRLGTSRRDAALLLQGLVALVCTARDQVTDASGKLCTTPLLNVRVQLWLRELSRMVVSVDAQPSLLFSDDLSGDALSGSNELPDAPAADDDEPDASLPAGEGSAESSLSGLALPLVHCRECHSAAWGTLKSIDSPQVSDDLSRIYTAYFAKDPDMVLLYPLKEGETPPAASKGEVRHLCPSCKRMGSANRDSSDECPHCQQPGRIRVWMPALIETRNDKTISAVDQCPCCQAHNGLSIVGSRAASLSSVMLSRLYQSDFNDDRKVIAFSDSVQDAAHRAGFFEARTWSQSLRQALIGWASQQRLPMDLDTLAQGFADNERQRAGSDADFVGRWLPPNLDWLQDARELQETGILPAGSELPELIAKRLDWEVRSELGLGSRIGRTLERQGLLGLGVDVSRLERTLTQLRHQWREQLPHLAAMAEPHSQVLEQWLLGVLHRMRVRGAFIHPAMREFIAQGGDNSFMLNRTQQSLFLPNYGPRRQPPAFVSLEPIGKFVDCVTGGSQGSARSASQWYRHWLTHHLPIDSLSSASDVAQAYRLAFEALSRAGLVEEQGQSQGRSIWGLVPAHWHASTQLLPLRCSQCSQRVQVPSTALPNWLNMHCLQPHCQGQLQAARPAHWSLTPAHQSGARLVSHEHTGLLDADTRARVEHSFIKGKRPWDINLLSATPTLEMGIDIGDLSTVLLCSTPPAQANYLQRIGRAGRRDGNALNLTIANGAPHDLYFFSRPQEMMNGEVATPGVFLKARAVLERQLLAFCLDAWMASHAQNGSLAPSLLPSRLTQVLDAVNHKADDGPNTGRFPYTLLGFIEEHHADLLARFLARFPHLDVEDRDYLSQQLMPNATAASAALPSGLKARVITTLTRRAEQRRAWKLEIKEYDRALEHLRSQPEDEHVRNEIEAIEVERHGRMSLLKQLGQQQTLNFFTDEGLLPNYAFPEEGVTLNGMVIRHVSKAQAASGKSYEVVHHEFQRPAQSALVELAPLNTFYALGRTLTIDQINLRGQDIEHWRLCSVCHYSESLAEGDIHGSCPRCGSPQWGDSAQKRSLLRLKEVTATVRDRDSRIGDDSDQRQPAFYNRQMLVDIKPNSASHAMRIDDPACPFGFEFIADARFVEINFGRGGDAGDTLNIAGKEAPRPGFAVCAHCGKVRYKGQKEKEQHTPWCKVVRNKLPDTPENLHNGLFLYRELHSEALRLLLPLSDVAMSERARQSLIASLHLGLKRYFRGSVDHLRLTEQEVPATQQQPARHYLVLYDTVPGGTGYLKELMLAPEKLVDMLALARDTMRDCACEDEPGRDGCYRCLLAYRQSRHLKDTSRDTALNLLERIISRRHLLTEVAGLEKIDLNVLVESELEQRFIDLLNQPSGNHSLGQELVDGTPGWRLTFKGQGDGPLVSWQIRPQAVLGPSQGVSRTTRPDFLMTPLSAPAGTQPIAIYLDGYQYHRERVGDDAEKRQAVLASGRYRVWTLTWRDLMGEKHQCASLADIEIPHSLLKVLQAKASTPETQEWLKALAPLSVNHARQLMDGSAFDALLTYAAQPDLQSKEWHQACLTQSLAWLTMQTHDNSSLLTRLSTELRENLLIPLADALLDTSMGPRLFGGVLDSFDNSQGRCEVLVSVPQTQVRSVSGIRNHLHLHLSLDDRDLEATLKDEDHWRRFWQQANLLQFAPRLTLSSTRGVAAGEGLLDPSCWWPADEDATSNTGHDDTRTDGAQADNAWEEIHANSLLDPEWVEALIAQEVAVPESGVDLLDANGEASIMLELSWPDDKVAISSTPLPEAFADWRVILFDDSTGLPIDKDALTQLGHWLAVTA
ncbi:DEAD/DEAH box helicase [bacterium Scap17]|nr:DEAD/DEAH box helicase [bacterium Scap17]